jgi:protease-4
LLVAIGWFGFVICGVLLLQQRAANRDYLDTSRGIRERLHSGAEYGSDKVAIIAVRGVILEGDGFVKRQIDRVRDDERVKAVVVRVESPGGTVTGSDYIYHHLNQLRQERDLPMVVSMGSIAASGGYYVSMAVGDQQRSIFAEPTTTTGSIGVIVPHYDLTGLLARFDIVDDSIMSHPRKQMLSMTRSMSDEDRQIIQQYVDDSFVRFKSIVKSGRPQLREASQEDELVDPQTDRDLATGEIFTAPRAQQYGLVDEIGFIEDAIARAVELAGLDEDNVRVVHYQRPASLMSLVGVAQASGQPGELAMLLEMSAPRAFYLATSLPPLLSSRR